MTEIVLPDELRAALEAGAGLVLSLSGGKDSDAMALLLVELHRRLGYTGKVVLVHADLGRAEHKETPEYVQELAQRLGLPLNIVRHSKYDLLGEIQHRMETVEPGVCPWPSSSARYCTSDQKRGPISKFIRHEFPTGTVVCAMGLRASESKNRAALPVFEPRKDCCASFRTVYNWLPIHNFSTEDVWATLEGQPRHPAYDRGNQRVSCALCVLASTSDILHGVENDPDLYRAYVEIEIESGFSFKNKWWLADQRPDLLTEDQRQRYADLKIQQKR